jgi:hypothetical protein
LANKKKENEGKTPRKGTKEKTKKSKSKQKITPKNAKHTMGSPKRRNQET